MLQAQIESEVSRAIMCSLQQLTTPVITAKAALQRTSHAAQLIAAQQAVPGFATLSQLRVQTDADRIAAHLMAAEVAVNGATLMRATAKTFAQSLACIAAMDSAHQAERASPGAASPIPAPGVPPAEQRDSLMNEVYRPSLSEAQN